MGVYICIDIKYAATQYMCMTSTLACITYIIHHILLCTPIQYTVEYTCMPTPHTYIAYQYSPGGWSRGISITYVKVSPGLISVSTTSS